jgi:uncharacterized membrane protein YkgB
MKNRILEIILGGIFVVAGFLKASDPLSFYDDIGSFVLFPPMMALLIALYLPYLEIICGLCLVFNHCKPAAISTLGGLLALFIGLLIFSWIRGLDIRCGCFGNSGSDMPAHYGWLLLRNAALLAAALYLLSKSAKKPSLSH